MDELNKGTEPRPEPDEQGLTWSLAGLLFAIVVALIIMKAPKRPDAPPGTSATLKEDRPADIGPAK